MSLINIHTHHAEVAREGLDCRLSYRPSEALRAEGLYSLGLHPCYAEDLCPEGLELLCQRLDKEAERVWAVGEAGLDKLSPLSLEHQAYYLRAQIRLSETYAKPLVLHCVRAFNELIALKRNLRPRQAWIIHGYRRKAGLAEQLLREGFALSFGYYFDSEALRLAHKAGLYYMETDDMDCGIELVAQRHQQALQA